MARSLGPKTKRFLAARNQPTATAFNFLQDIEGMAEEQARAAVDEKVKAVEKELEKEIKQVYAKAAKNIEAWLRTMTHETGRQVKQKINSIPHLKGEAGYTPQKGVDYFDGQDGAPGDTPIPGVDYPSMDSVASLINEHVDSFKKILEARGLTKQAIIDELNQKGLDPVTVARALETLRGADRLDFEALKSRPGSPVADTAHRHTLHRGGAKQVYDYDLSSLCDGNTRVFTVPANTRILSAHCSDAPSGVLRPVTDWTGSGTTTFTLTNQVAAPGSGATLYILYVA